MRDEKDDRKKRDSANGPVGRMITSSGAKCYKRERSPAEDSTVGHGHSHDKMSGFAGLRGLLGLVVLASWAGGLATENVANRVSDRTAYTFRALGTGHVALSHAHVTISVSDFARLIINYRQKEWQVFNNLTSDNKRSGIDPGIKASVTNTMKEFFDSAAAIGLDHRCVGVPGCNPEALDERARQKRVAFLPIALGVGAAFWTGSSIYSIFSGVDLSSFREEVNGRLEAIEDTQDVIIEKLDTHSETLNLHTAALAKLDAGQHANTFAIMLEASTRKFSDTVETLLAGRISPGILPPSEVRKTLKKVAERAAKQGYVLLVDTISHFYQCESSFIADAAAGMLHVMVHLPIAEMRQEVTLLSFR